MKRLIRFSAISILSLLAFAPIMASAANSAVKVSSPFASTGNVANTRKFNLTVSALSSNQSDIIDVTLKQNGTTIATFKDGSTTYGSSWSKAVTVPSDGTYTYVAQSSLGDSSSVTVKVDTTPPASLVYKGSVRVGNTYTVTFTAPVGSGITLAKIYSSTSPNFIAGTNTLVGQVPISEGQTKSFTYTTPDSVQRYNAVLGFDSDGNAAAVLVGDPNTSATTAAQTTSTSTTTSTGQVQGAETNKKKLATAAAAAAAAALRNKKTASTTSTTNNKSDSSTGNTIFWIVIILVVAGLAAAYIRYLRGGEDDNQFWPKNETKTKTTSTTKKKK